MEHTAFVCNCASPEHLLLISYDDYPAFPDKEVYFRILLEGSGGFWDRLRRAIDVFMGRDTAPYAEVILTKERVSDLIDALEGARQHASSGGIGEAWEGAIKRHRERNK